MRKLEISPRRWILSPIAIKARDLDGNGLLAFAAAERGFGVLLGSAKLKHRPYTPRGFVIEKNLRPGKAIQIVEASRTTGHKIGAWCDEGLIYKDAESYRRLKFDEEAYRSVSRYFTWGKHQASDLVEEFGCSAEKICNTGNPRFDLHRPDLRGVLASRTERIRHRYGRYILVNTKFSTFNGFAGSEKNVSGMKARGMLQTPEHESEAIALSYFQGAVFTEFMLLIEQLSSRFPDYTIIVRPHPSEDHDPWQAKARTLPNVAVVYEGNVAEWILASEICIHNNCTTGVEAFLLGKPVISYRPVQDSRFDLFLPNALSSEAFDLEQLLEMVAATLTGTAALTCDTAAARAQTARHFITNIEGRLACDSICEALHDVDLPEVPLSLEVSWLEDVRARTRRWLAPVKQAAASREAISRDRFARQKFNGLHSEETTELLRSAQRVTRRFGNVRIMQIEEGVVCVY